MTEYIKEGFTMAIRGVAYGFFGYIGIWLAAEVLV